MAQQINLYSPILLTPKRYFSALAMAQAIGVLAAGLAALCLWSVLATQRLQADLASATSAYASEKQRLATEIAQRPALPKDSAALEQELARTTQALADSRALLDELAPAAADPERSRSALLRLLAQTVPPTVWLTELKLVDGQIDLAGMTLQPDALRPWLATLSQHPATAGQSLRAVKVERSDTGAPGGAEAWAFHVVSSQPEGARP